MKNRLFIIAVITITLFLAVLWDREQTYNMRLKHIKDEVMAVEARVRLLKLKTRALKAEVELLDIANQIDLLKGWNRQTSLTGKMPTGQKQNATMRQVPAASRSGVKASA